MELSSIMASQLRSLQSAVQMSVLNQSLKLNTSAATEMLDSLPNQASVAHPHKGAAIDVKV
ncbi:putative motility protein [Sporosarcina ureilytica]|uniref:Putative motility protein n=1 Tax=Sporosarcina ureilytica TaxID=298596 RepID=A0A1D8JEC8_9BACL|nr:putative motility protein [Sporosarcina ureilytica]AOV07033.1 putative motility protein [Sporosarcina ureilytica]